MKIEFLLSKEQKAAALECERRWQAWLRDPEHNTAPNAKADTAAAQREYKSAGGDWRAEHAERVRRIIAQPVRRGQGNPTPAEPAEQSPDDLGNTMIQRAGLHLRSILAERERDPEPSREDFVGHTYWDRREEKRRALMSRWWQYLL